MKCKICGDPIFNRYANRWFHTWTHDHWAVREDQQTSTCRLCGGIIHYNDHNWWHIQDDKCKLKHPTPKNEKCEYNNESQKTNNITENEKSELMRNKKCSEIKEWIIKLENFSSRDESEINKYKGWLHWWETTGIEDIIKEKGNSKGWGDSQEIKQIERIIERPVLIHTDPNTRDDIKYVIFGIFIIVISGIILYILTGR